jgi:senataxin
LIVIAFYRRQVAKIKDQLRKRLGPESLNAIDVMTVDGFQGQEKEIILLSCVRTGKGLGFITDIRRMVCFFLFLFYKFLHYRMLL